MKSSFYTSDILWWAPSTLHCFSFLNRYACNHQRVTTYNIPWRRFATRILLETTQESRWNYDYLFPVEWESSTFVSWRHLSWSESHERVENPRWWNQQPWLSKEERTPTHSLTELCVEEVANPNRRKRERERGVTAETALATFLVTQASLTLSLCVLYI